MNYKKLTDNHLVDLLRGMRDGEVSASGQERAFGEIYRRYWLRLFQTAWQKTGSRDAAEEIVQDLFVRLWERRPELQITSSLNSYLHAAIRYRVINYIRNQLLTTKHLSVIREGVSEQGENTVETELRLRELDTSLQASIEKLPEKSRTIFELSRSRHFSNKQIAGKLNISEKTVEYHLSKSLRLLRVYLKDFVTILSVIMLIK